MRGRSSLTRFRIAVLALVAAIVLIVTVTSLGLAAGPTVPPTPTTAACRKDAMAHVHDPGRFTVLAPCVVVSGTLTSARLEAAFLDEKGLVVVDRRYTKFLRPENHGNLIVDVVPTDILSVDLPASGGHATFYGAWVLNRATKAVELHPAWRVVPSPGSKTVTGGSEPKQASLHVGQKLALSVHAPVSVTVGGSVVADLDAKWMANGKSEPASEVRVFLEVTDSSGNGVRWKALRTNTLGKATAKLVTLQVPGDYRVTVYPVTAGATGPVSAVLAVKRR